MSRQLRIGTALLLRNRVLLGMLPNSHFNETDAFSVDAIASTDGELKNIAATNHIFRISTSF